MYANTCWGFLGFALALGLAVLGLPPEYVWLRPWFAAAALACFLISIALFCWPLIGRMMGYGSSDGQEITNANLREQASQLAREMRVYATGVQAEMRRHYQQIAKPDGSLPDEVDHTGNELSTKLAEHFDLDLRPKAVELRLKMLKRIGRLAEPGGGFHSFALDGQAAHPYMIHRAADLLEAIAQQLP